MKQSVARVLEKLQFEPIILHEKPNFGSSTIIEKFMTYSEVGFAIVLLTVDDLGYSIKTGTEYTKKRPRQNVVFELGYFFGKLERNKVIALIENLENFDIPSDIQGIIYIQYDKSGNWKFEIAKELRENG